MKDGWEERVSEPVALDEYGTVRVSDSLGSVAVYIKVSENAWAVTYVDPKRGESLVSNRTVSDVVAGFGSVVYAPKPVVVQGE